ncbi:MAG: peptide deformylase [Candidatus Melainabacteria bacterium RIFOXYA2_FULL_32_9]|nr:MAG: peptide deformylase [Candidatus Melainabacteria bacterium RIFOXYA2_FULL_32_9]
MAIRKVVQYGDKVLRTPTKEVHKISSKIQKLIDDLMDTMYAQNGVGLAAPQVGESYRIFVIDTSTGDEPLNPIVFVNPKIIKKSGATLSYEGCLSFPEAYTNVKRYAEVIVRAKDEKGRPFTIEAKDGSLLARAIQHEMDHLDGILFIDHSMNRFETNQELANKGLPPVDPEYLLDEAELEELLQKCAAAKGANKE